MKDLVLNRKQFQKLYRMLIEREHLEEELAALLHSGQSTEEVAQRLSQMLMTTVPSALVVTLQHLYALAQKENTSVVALLRRVLTGSPDEGEHNQEIARRVRELSYDLRTLDHIIAQGLQYLKRGEVVVSPRDVVQAIQLKDALLEKHRDALLQRVAFLESAIVKILRIVTEEVPPETVARIRERVFHEVGEIDG